MKSLSLLLALFLAPTLAAQEDTSKADAPKQINFDIKIESHGEGIPKTVQKMIKLVAPEDAGKYHTLNLPGGKGTMVIEIETSGDLEDVKWALLQDSFNIEGGDCPFSQGQKTDCDVPGKVKSGSQCGNAVPSCSAGAPQTLWSVSNANTRNLWGHSVRKENCAQDGALSCNSTLSASCTKATSASCGSTSASCEKAAVAEFKCPHCGTTPQDLRNNSSADGARSERERLTPRRQSELKP